MQPPENSGNLFTRFSRISDAERGIFRNEDVLRPEFLPEILPGREQELKEIASCFQPLAEGRKASNVFLCGPPGTGKTACSRLVLRELGEYSEKVFCAYVNCWQNSTRQSVLTQLSNSLGEVMPRRGIAADEVLNRVLGVSRNTRRNALIVLDEFDRLRGGEERVLYDLLRANETHGLNFAVALVSNDENLLARIDERTRSSLQAKKIVFERYSPNELKRILSERGKNAFLEGACGGDVIALCAAFGAKNGGDARIALQALWRSAKNAEKRGANKISAEDAKKAFSEQSETTASQEKRLAGLSETEKKIIEILRKQKKPINSGTLYTSLKNEASERTLRNYLAILENKRIIATREIEKGDGGKSREIRLLV